MIRAISTVEFREDRGMVQEIEVPTPFDVLHADITVRAGGVDVITLHVLHERDAATERISFRLVPEFAPIADSDVHVASVLRTLPYPMAMFDPGPAVLHLFRSPTLLERQGGS